MVVGLAVLGLGLGLAIHAGTQALRAGREALATSQVGRRLAWRMETEWARSLRVGGTISGPGWSVSTTRIIPSVDGEGWAICRVEAAVDGPRRRRVTVTRRFCPPPAR
jgi:hypothetical protein